MHSSNYENCCFAKLFNNWTFKSYESPFSKKTTAFKQKEKEDTGSWFCVLQAREKKIENQHFRVTIAVLLMCHTMCWKISHAVQNKICITLEFFVSYAAIQRLETLQCGVIHRDLSQSFLKWSNWFISLSVMLVKLHCNSNTILYSLKCSVFGLCNCLWLTKII